MIPELELGVLDKLNEGDEEPPGVRSVHYQSLQQNPTTQSYILLHNYMCNVYIITNICVHVHVYDPLLILQH